MRDEVGEGKNVVEGFLPSVYGLKYPNIWPHVPYLELAILGSKKIAFGDASNGMCGGMVHAARDLFERRMPAPVSTIAPEHDSPQFKFLFKRSLQSFNLPTGVLDYYGWMNLAPHDVPLFGGLFLRGTSWRTINESMPALKKTIDSGHPCPLGLVCVQSSDPMKLGLNHQVLAWGYEITEAMTTINVYDPNHPCDDSITISFENRNSEQATVFNLSTNDHMIYGFFTTHYSTVDPAPLIS